MQIALMNYYKRNIRDYSAATRHLSILEHGVYTLLMDRYYESERCLPADLMESARMIGARAKPEIAAVRSVLKDFFVESSDGWHQDRCEQEISTYQGKAIINREHGKLGGRPKKQKPKNNPNGLNTETQEKPKRLANGNPDVTQGISETKPRDNPEITQLQKERARQTPDSDSEDQGSSAAEPLAVDPRKAIWDLGVSLLGADARSVIGAAIKRVGESKVGEILGQMAVRAPAEPKTWFIKATQERGVVC